MKIQQIDIIPLKLDLISDVAPHLYRSNHQGRIVLYRLHLGNGIVGYGEGSWIADGCLGLCRSECGIWLKTDQA